MRISCHFRSIPMRFLPVLVLASLFYFFVVDTLIVWGEHLLLSDPPVVIWQQQEVGIEQENIEVYYYNKPVHVSLTAFSRCPDRCSMTSGGGGHKYKKAVIFHGPTVYGGPPRKYRGQLWIIHSMEAPITFAQKLKDWTRVFNWTLVHRRDSDIFAPYGSLAPITSQSPHNGTRPVAWTTKDKMAAWFVSNCDAQSRRQEYVRNLQEDVDVHIYGKCGNMTCSSAIRNRCLHQLQDHYRFYLAFENSLCADYITEKVMGLLQEGIDVIPVVRGTGDLYKLYLPPDSYISAHEYSIKRLAQKMQSISKSRAQFENYFAWRRHYYAEEIDRYYCDLCKKLHNANQYKRLYESVTDWLLDHPHHRNCQNPTDIPDKF